MWDSPTGGESLLSISGEIISMATYQWNLICFATGFILFVFVTWHVFKDHSTYYSLERDLMWSPSYEIAFQGTNLLLNRRKQRRNLIRDNTQGHSDPYVFICTTLWQENEQEMETLLQSLVRLSRHLG